MSSDQPVFCDIVVVGAGPAGALAAQSAAQAGRRVCLIERKERVGDPVRCGEGIGLKGFSKSIELDPAWILAPVKSMAMISPGGITVNIAVNDPGFILDRLKMDADLAARAVAAGASYHPSTTILSVVRQTDGRYLCTGTGASFNAACVILAEGVESRLARGLGWSTALALNDLHTCVFCKVTHPAIEAEKGIFYVGAAYTPGGYVWVFPRGRGEANVGLGINGSYSAAGKAHEYLQRFIDKYYAGAEVRDMHAGGVPAAPWMRPLVREGVMLVGDAARQVNCMTGAGIAYGMIAGQCAGTVAAEAFVDGSFNIRHLRRYEKIWASTFGKPQRHSYALKQLLLKDFDDPSLDRIATDLARTDMNRLTYMRVFLRAFIRRPTTWLRVIRLFG
jgi:digeranylgeranylglycerophospholipid reductase